MGRTSFGTNKIWDGRTDGQTKSQLEVGAPPEKKVRKKIYEFQVFLVTFIKFYPKFTRMES